METIRVIEMKDSLKLKLHVTTELACISLISYGIKTLEINFIQSLIAILVGFGLSFMKHKYLRLR
jgi:hypothetical protein